MGDAKYSGLQIAAIAVLVLSLVVQSLIGIFHNSVVWDELCFVGAGKAIFSTGSTKYNILSDQPPLSYYINSLFLMPLKFEEKILSGGNGNKLCWQIGHDILFNSGYSTRAILLLSRLPFMLLSILLSFYVLRWSSELFGAKAGLLSMFLYSFNPSIIAYSGIATADFTAAAMIFISVYYFWKLMTRPSSKHLLLTGVFFGLAQLSKITAAVLVPIFLIIGLVQLRKNYKPKLKIFFRNILVILLIAFIMIWSFYKFQFGPVKDYLLPPYFSEKAHEEIGKAGILSKPLLFIYDKVPLPAPSFIGMYLYIPYISLKDQDTFAFGKIISESVWYMGLLMFALKTPVPLILTIMLLLFFRKLPKNNADKLCLLLPIISIFLIFSFNNKLSGIRHMLAVYPFIFVLAGNLASIRINWKKTAMAGLLFSYAASAFLTVPYYLSYINLLGGGPGNAYKIMVGSNIDQGQDLLELREYMRENNISKIKLSYWGSVDPGDYGINFDYLPSPYFQPWQNNYTHVVTAPKKAGEDCSDKKGLIAISVTNLQNVHLINKTCYNWLKSHAPTEKIGYSIFIYDIK